MQSARARMIVQCLALVLAAAVLPAAQERAQPDTLDAVLARAGQYVVSFQQKLSGIVAEEYYVQEPTPQSTRILKSDLLLVRPEGADRWIQFRDVFEVDGRPVRDRTDRLAKLFLQPSPSTAAQVREIVRESTRYNVGDVERTVNVPVFALAFLEPARQQGFTFKRRLGLHQGLPRTPTFAIPEGTWVVEFNETRPRRSIFNARSERFLATHGRFWIEPATGRVLVTELIAEDRELRGRILVAYRPQPPLDLLVPAEMRERYDKGTSIRRAVIGTATYGNFRQFQVKVDEKFGPVKNEDGGRLR